MPKKARNRIRTKKKDPSVDWTEFVQNLLHIPKDENRLSDQQVRPMIASRMNGIAALTLAFLILLMGRAGFIMLIPDKRIENQAQRQFEFYEEIQGRRGNILDRNHELLATSVNLWNLVLDPSRIRAQDIQKVVSILDEELEIDASRLQNRILSRKNRRWLSVRKKDHTAPIRLDPADVERIQNRLQELRKEHLKSKDRDFTNTYNAISFEETSYRFYPNRDDGAPILGWTNREGEGAGGLELSYDSTLRGEKFRIVSIRDRQNNKVYRPLHQQGMPQAQDGNSIVLTLDRGIQHATDVAIKKTLERTKAKSAFAVVMNIKKGEILAISNQPTINLNDRSQLDIDFLQNYAANATYEPGSVIKPLVAGIALQEKEYSPSTLIDCENGVWASPGGRITDEHKSKIISLTEVIQHSSNIGISKVSLQLGAERVLGYLQDFGFGKRSEIRFPSSPRGVLRNPKTIKPIELMTTSYGYGLSTTMLQLASAYATLGNGGKRMKPILVKEKLNANMEVVERNQPEVTHSVLSKKNANAVIRMMERVVSDGTGRSIKVPGYRFAGKTGTAKKIVKTEVAPNVFKNIYSTTDRIGSFIGIIPSDAPEIVIAVTVDTPTVGQTFGSAVAGPAFSEIALASMRRLGISPDPNLLEESQNKTEEIVQNLSEMPEIQWRSNKEFATPNLIGLSMRDAIQVLGSANLDIRLQGHGRVITQQPQPGSLIEPQETVELKLQ
ncbi:MAG: penicillin-binding protein [Myxococcota bacterium]|nr:penicillin-binding protein [Myxococcota bacterium]